AVAETLSKHKGNILSPHSLIIWNDDGPGPDNPGYDEREVSLTELSDAAAESLSKYQGDLFLNITNLTNASLTRKLAGQEEIYLNGLTELSDATAKTLAKHKGDLHLEGLTELSAAAAKSLAKHQGDLFLDRFLYECSVDSSGGYAELFARHKGPPMGDGWGTGNYLNFDHLTELSDADAEGLSKYQGRLHLKGLTELSDAAAESLSWHEGGLNLSGLTELSDAAAESFSRYCRDKHKGELHLFGLT
ncbi:hypothetical protein OAF55_02645, partial [Akkermansiaceae bacterium]|nr:hypothetical protein [Akkermansiaceae bacterium]